MNECLLCGAELVWMPQHGGWNAHMPDPKMELGAEWCPENDPLLILGRDNGTWHGYGKHIPARDETREDI